MMPSPVLPLMGTAGKFLYGRAVTALAGRHYRMSSRGSFVRNFSSATTTDLSAECADFLALCRSSGGEGAIDLNMDDATGLAELKLNNPAKRNAMSGTMMLQLEEAVTKLERWEQGRCVFLSGEGHAFCSGGDLDFVRVISTPELGFQMCTFMQHTLERLSKLPFVSIGVLRGAAHGGGAELTTATDFRVMGRTCEVKFVQAKLNITTGWGGATRLAKIIGPRAAFAHLSSSMAISVASARQLGYCELITKDLEVLDMAKVWFYDNFGKFSPQIARAYKGLLLNQDPNTSTAVLYKIERDIFRKTWGSPAHLAALETALVK